MSKMQGALKEQGLVVILDYTAPSRRDPFFCLVNAVELAAGRNHFRDYVNQGGLDALLNRYGLEEKKAYLLRGLVTMPTASNV